MGPDEGLNWLWKDSWEQGWIERMRKVPDQWFLNLGINQNQLEGLLNTDCWALPSDFLIQKVWSEAREFAFLTSF